MCRPLKIMPSSLIELRGMSMFCEQVRFVAPSTTALPGRLSDARKAKPLPPKFRRSPNTIEDSSLYELAINRDVPLQVRGIPIHVPRNLQR